MPNDDHFDLAWEELRTAVAKWWDERTEKERTLMINTMGLALAGVSSSACTWDQLTQTAKLHIAVRVVYLQALFSAKPPPPLPPEVQAKIELQLTSKDQLH